MQNTFGNNLTITVFGESHGSKIGAVIDGLPAGIKIDYDYIDKCLSLRRPMGKIETLRVEKDNYEIVSGVFNGFSTGSSICILILNENINSSSYEKNKDLARPSHADYVANEKYHGYNDYRGGGHFSGRITAAIVAAGAIVLSALEKFKIKIGYHIKQVGDVIDSDFSKFPEQIDMVNEMTFPTLDDVSEKMSKCILDAANNNDSIGGIIQTAIINLPLGLGDPMFENLEGKLAKAMFSIGGVKGIEFGLGFKFANSYGSKANDEFKVVDGKVITLTNNNGGINGGITNSMPVVFNLAVKPTPSIAKTQQTINMKTMTNETINISGRHDPAIVRRVGVVVKAMAALVIADVLITKYGQDVFLKESL